MNPQRHMPLFRDYPQLAERLPYVSLATLPTPVERMERFGRTLGLNNLYIKRDDLSGATYGSNKVRKLEFLFGDILRTNAKEVITLGFAGSNHALATAIYAHQLGLTSTSMLMPQANAHYVRRNLLASHYYNAQLRYYRNIPILSFGIIGQLLCGLVRHGVLPRVIPAGGTCPYGIVSYVNAAMELKDQIAAGELPEPDVIYVPLGSMGTSAGLMIGLETAGLKTRVIPVRVIEKKMAGPKRMIGLMKQTVSLLHRLDPSFPSINIPRSGLGIRNDCMGDGYAQFTEKAARAAQLMKKHTGIILNGTYSAKAFSALLDDAKENRLNGKTVLYWNTYNSRDLSVAADSVDYHQLPKQFHHYFEKDVQPLDTWEG